MTCVLIISRLRTRSRQGQEERVLQDVQPRKDREGRGEWDSLEHSTASHAYCQPIPKIRDQSTSLGTVRATKTVKRRTSTDLPLSNGEILQVIAMHDCPRGKWVAKNKAGEIGFITCAEVEADVRDMRSFMSVVTPSKARHSLVMHCVCNSLQITIPEDVKLEQELQRKAKEAGTSLLNLTKSHS